jgi:hypothetical protein
MRIHIEFEISPRAKRLLKIGVPAAVLLVGSVAVANVPNTFKDGDALSAQTMNDNFVALDTRLTNLEALTARQTADGGYSLGATFCGATGQTKGDLSGLPAAGSGYAKARAQCQTTCSSPTAHMCTAEELIRSAALGKTIGGGWYSTGTNVTGVILDCNDWTEGTDPNVFGPAWSTGASDDRCTYTHAVACCD